MKKLFMLFASCALNIVGCSSPDLPTAVMNPSTSQDSQDQYLQDSSDDNAIKNDSTGGDQSNVPSGGCSRLDIHSSAAGNHIFSCGMIGSSVPPPGCVAINRAELPNAYYVKVSGEAPRWQITMDKFLGGVMDPAKKKVMTYTSAQTERAVDGAYLFPIAAMNPPTDKVANLSALFTAQALSADGKPYGQTCDKMVQINNGSGYGSPIVLDLSAMQKPLQTISISHSKVQFDLYNRGRRVKTGWINPHAGFLAIDRNNNKIIDHGGELFGEYSEIAPLLNRFDNGYEALQHFDTNRDGFVDRTDKDFSRLIVWIDDNIDGVSQHHELHSLRALGITKIQTSYRNVAVSVGEFDNRIPYASKFWGPTQCKKVGCNSYDVFFGTMDSYNLSLNEF